MIVFEAELTHGFLKIFLILFGYIFLIGNETKLPIMFLFVLGLSVTTILKKQYLCNYNLFKKNIFEITLTNGNV